MRNRLIIVVLFFLLTACVPGPIRTEIQTLPENPAAQPTPSSSVDNNLQSTAVPGSTNGDEIPSSVEYTNGSLWLRLFTPKDGDIVNQKVINVSGQAPVETVISLNEDIILVGNEGSFSIPVTLDEGPNVIELVASNVDGDIIELVLTIVYEE
jgi:hypothetical protein